MQTILLAGENAPDELYVKAICLKIKRTFPNRTPDQVYQDYLQAIQDFKQQTADPNMLSDDFSQLEGINKEEFHKRNLINSVFPYTKGWLLSDFPHNYNQA
jgi:hypothetical protein